MSSGFDSLAEFRDGTINEEPTPYVRKPKVPSRGGDFDRDVCRKNAGGGQHVMILVAARMAREILKERRKSEMDPFVTGIDGLLKLESGDFELEDYYIKPSPEWVRKYYDSRLNEGWFWFR